MKTSAMIAMLEVNPKLKFKRTGEKGTYQLHESGKLALYYDGGYYDGKLSNFITHIINVADDWQLVREPVPWQDAMQAWIDGKTITMEGCKGGSSGCHKCEYQNGKKKQLRSGDVMEYMCQEMFSTGKWYIKSEGEE